MSREKDTGGLLIVGLIIAVLMFLVWWISGAKQP
jgi:hypothetical protein